MGINGGNFIKYLEKGRKNFEKLIKRSNQMKTPTKVACFFSNIQLNGLFIYFQDKNRVKSTVLLQTQTKCDIYVILLSFNTV